MKTHNDLFEAIGSFENLLGALKLARRAKRFVPNVASFCMDQERAILALREELASKTYRPGRYKEMTIHHPKRRMISAAPFRDRVVHHALCRVVMPMFERKMIDDLYSNRTGKGTHAGIVRCQHFARRYPYVLKCDVRKFFPSMDHLVLKSILRRTIRCRDTLWLLDAIIDGSNPQEAVCCLYPGDDIGLAAARRVGLPIGNLTSQWFGGIYLSEFDHWVKETLHCPGYVRYVDDFLLFAEDTATLREWRVAIQEKLEGVRLRLNERKSRSYRTSDGVTFLGQRIWPDHRRLPAQNVRAAKRRLAWYGRRHQSGLLSADQLQRRWNSWRGHALQANGQALVARMTPVVESYFGATGSRVSRACVAARGTMTRPTCGVPSATTTGRVTTTTTTASVV